MYYWQRRIAPRGNFRTGEPNLSRTVQSGSVEGKRVRGKETEIWFAAYLVGAV